MAEQSVECPSSDSVKKIKIDDNGKTANESSLHSGPINLSNFEMKEILDVNTERKLIIIHGTFKGYDAPAVVVLEKKIFPDEEIFLKRGFFNEGTIIRKLYNNDIYGNYECFPTREHNGLNATIIYPATQKHIDKFMRKELYLISESYDNYTNITLPTIELSNFSLQWVDNILNGKAEQEAILYDLKDDENGFVLIPDLKWDGQPATLKVIAITRKRLKSIRELNETHLPLLKNILKTGTDVISKKFSLSSFQIRVYLHYQPSYYHLHVHFTHLMNPTAGTFIEKAHLLTTVINNIELMSDYYQKCELSFVVKEEDALFEKYVEHGLVTLIEKTQDNEQKVE